MFKSLAICLIAGILPGATFASAAEPAKNQPPDPPKAAKSPADRAVMTPEREAAAITFVRQHHPELVDLLNQLKESRPTEYQSAIRELFQTSERLAQLREQDPERYELELKAWEVKSRIQLLAARSTMSSDKSGDKSLEEQLHAALAEQADIRLRQMKLDRDRTAERLQKLDTGIEQYQQSEAAEVERQFEKLLKHITGSREQIQAGKPAAAAAKTNPKPDPSAASVTPK